MNRTQRLIEIGAADWQVTNGKGRVSAESLRAIAQLLHWSTADCFAFGDLRSALKTARRFVRKIEKGMS